MLWVVGGGHGCVVMRWSDAPRVMGCCGMIEKYCCLLKLCAGRVDALWTHRKSKVLIGTCCATEYNRGDEFCAN